MSSTALQGDEITDYSVATTELHKDVTSTPQTMQSLVLAKPDFLSQSSTICEVLQAERLGHEHAPSQQEKGDGGLMAH